MTVHMRNKWMRCQLGTDLAVPLCDGTCNMFRTCTEDADKVTCQNCLERMAKHVETVLTRVECERCGGNGSALGRGGGACGACDGTGIPYRRPREQP